MKQPSRITTQATGLSHKTTKKANSIEKGARVQKEKKVSHEHELSTLPLNIYKAEPGTAPAILTIPQVAERLHVCRAHVYKLIGQGLPTVRLGRSVRILEPSLYDWLMEQTASN